MGDNEKREQMKNVIAKLLEIAMHPKAQTDPSLKAEAESAMEKAKFLMDKYNIERAEAVLKAQQAGNLDELMGRVDLETYYKGAQDWEAILGNCIGRLYDVEICWIKGSSWNNSPDKLAFVGNSEDVANVVYFFEYLQFKIAQKIRGIELKRAKNDFARGAVSALETRLQELIYYQKHSGDANTMALTVVNKNAVTKEYKKHFPRTQQTSARRIGDAAMYNKGKEYGKRVPLSHGVGNNGGGSNQSSSVGMLE